MSRQATSAEMVLQGARRASAEKMGNSRLDARPALMVVGISRDPYLHVMVVIRL
eukprot:COSAG05_NODE_63_length_22889_cov_41.986617_12_plen_54_part_00